MKTDYSKMKIVYMGTPAISAYVLDALIASGYNIVAVITQPDKEVGKNNVPSFSPVKKVALSHNIPVYQPVKIRKDFEFLNEIKPDLILTLAYGQIIPQAMIDIPKFGCLNLHGSLLPKYRGAAPIQYALINNEKTTGMSLMEMTADMDAGKVFDTNIISIDEEDNCTTLFEKMAVCAKELAIRSLPKYFNNELPGIEQDINLVTFAPSIKDEEERLDINYPTNKFIGWVRALADKPGGYLILNKQKIKIFKAKKYSDISGLPGDVVKADKNGLVIQLSDGQVSILELQKEGKKRMDYSSFVNGAQDLMNQHFE